MADLIDMVDLICVMTMNPGGRESFIHRSWTRSCCRGADGHGRHIEVDGGVTVETAALVQRRALMFWWRGLWCSKGWLVVGRLMVLLYPRDPCVVERPPVARLLVIGVTFDLDGTLIHSAPTSRDRRRKVRRPLRAGRDESSIVKGFIVGWCGCMW